jgi:Flp pilus assembly protein CpaB
VVLFSIAQDGSRAATEDYVVAKRALAIGTRVTAADLATARLHVPDGPLRTRVFSRVSAVVGSVVVSPLASGDLVQGSALVRDAAGPGERQISVPIETARALGDRLAPGELVDVVATFGAGSDAYTITVVSAARVVSRDGGGGSLGDHKSEVVTLAVRDAQAAVAIAHAVAAGEISFVRVTSADNTQLPADPYRAPKPGGVR